MRKNVLNWEIESMYQEIFRDIPGAKDNPFVMERYSLFMQIEDPYERAPALSEIFEEKSAIKGEYSKLNPVELAHYKQRFPLTHKKEPKGEVIVKAGSLTPNCNSGDNEVTEDE